MRKAQTEMIGLVIVLIILSLAALFAIKFLVLDKKSNENFKDNSLSIQANNLLSAVIKTNTAFPNCKKTLGELIGACCDSIPNQMCGKSCTDIQAEITRVLTKVNNLEYNFEVKSCRYLQPISSTKFSTCSEVPASPSYPIIVIDTGTTYDATLQACKI